MARYSYDRRRRSLRRWLYAIAVLVIFIVLTSFIFDYNPFSGGKDKPLEPLAVTDTAESELKDEAINQRRAETPDLVDEALQILEENQDRIIEARQLLNEALPTTGNPQQQAFVKSKLSELADEWLFSRTIYPQDKLCSTYKVEPGEQLRYIASRFNVPYEALMEINKISDAKNLKAGQVIKIVHGPFHAVIDRSDFTMDLYLQDTFVRSFPVGMGKKEMETPTGLWVVKQGGKMIKPRWTDPVSKRTYEQDDPDYPLGSRWIGLEGIEGDALDQTGFAIHGTKDPKTINTRSSQGCIRLHNGNVILVYKLLKEGVSKIRIVD